MRTLLLTLILVAAVNASQSLVLCLGHNGHVAIEPAGHRHCGAEHARVPDPVEPHAHIGDDHCQPCTDIPITLWARNDSDGSPAGKAPVATPVAFLSLPHPADGTSIPRGVSGSPPPTSHHAPLHTIILQV